MFRHRQEITVTSCHRHRALLGPIRIHKQLPVRRKRQRGQQAQNTGTQHRANKSLGLPDATATALGGSTKQTLRRLSLARTVP